MDRYRKRPAPSPGDLLRHHYRSSTPPKQKSSASALPRKNASFFENSASKWASINIALRSSTKTVKQPSLSLTRRASENAQSTLPSAGTLSQSVKTLRSPTSKSSTGVAPRCSPTFLRHHVPHQLSSHFAIISSDTGPRSWLMTTSNYSLICENAWTHHLSLRISGSGAPCLSQRI